MSTKPTERRTVAPSGSIVRDPMDPGATYELEFTTTTTAVIDGDTHNQLVNAALRQMVENGVGIAIAWDDEDDKDTAPVIDIGFYELSSIKFDLAEVLNGIDLGRNATLVVAGILEKAAARLREIAKDPGLED